MVKSTEEVEYMVNELEGTEIPLDEYMKGYLAALKWVLSNQSLSEEIQQLSKGDKKK